MKKFFSLKGKVCSMLNPIERLHIKSFKMTDGPLGVSWQSSARGKRTRFPATIALAASWNKEISFKQERRWERKLNLLDVINY